MKMIIVYTTFSSQEEAEKVMNEILLKKLIACVNFFPIKSLYWWNEKIENSEEVVAIAKTKAENWEKVKSEIKGLHPYEVPCIFKINVEADKEYDSWINRTAEN